MSRLGAYLPQDRLRSLVTEEPLSARTQGSALFADISGFTVLTEELTRRHGPRKGVDELSRLLDRVYGALIERVEAYGGVIISFAGDSILVWFEGDDSAASLAVACAHSMAEAMREFSGLSLRTSITTGAARRLVVGDPTIQHIDTLAGRTIARLATGERLAERGEILLDTSTREALGAQVRVEGERVDEASGERFYCSGGLTMPVSPRPLSPMEEASVPPEKLRSWLLPTVFEREMRGLSSFLTELRPVAPVFIRFTDLDYDNDEDAAHKLNAFIVHVQRVVSQQDGSLLQLVIGDKGCYVYAVFGAPTAHEDDTLRALHASVELAQTPHVLDFIPSVQIGVSLGTMRVGAYGSATRRTYSALGDEVNLAARLMTIADPGEILVTGRVQKAVAGIFDLQPHEAITVKGKQEPQPVFSITGLSRQRATRLPEPNYRLPMIGRQEELALVDEKLNLALQGKGQVIGIEADAGMGKSRLVAEIIRLARKRGFVGYGGACQSSGMNTPYLVWQAIWQAFFDLDPEMPQRKQMRLLEVTIEDLAPERVESLPLLGLALDLPLPANDFTTALDPKDRKNALEALLEDCLRSEAKESPLLFVLEDLHWVDPASSDLLATLARVSADLPVCFVLAYRPPDVGRRVALSHETLPYFTRLALTDLSAAEASQLIRSKLAQLFPERGGPLPAALVQELTSRSQGNPFFIEELLNYLHDRGLNPYDENALTALELPASLQTLILSRMDQLSEQQKVTLKVASVIGRVFPFLWLRGYYPSLGEEENIKRNLLELSRLELTPLDTPEPELSYLFKHIITQEVAYESLSYNTRAQLHEKLAQYIEESYPEDLPLNVLAYHYSRSDNLAKKREYLRRSGEAAQAVYSNAAALDYYGQALASSPSPSEAIDLHLKMGTILHIVSEWDAARLHFDQALEIASAQGMEQQIVQSRLKLGALLTSRAEYRQAVEWLQATHALAERIHEEARAAESLAEIGTVYWRMGEGALARPTLEQSIELAHRLGENRTEGIARLALASLKAEQGEYAESHKDFDIALALARAASDKRRVASVLLNSGTTYYYEGKYDIARERISQCLAAVREIGDKRFTSIALNNLGNIYFIEGDYQTAGKYYAEALAMARSITDRYTMAISLTSSGITAFQQGDLALAETCYNESLSLNRELGDKLSISLVYCYLGLLALARDQFNMARSHFREGLTVSFGINAKSYVIYNLVGFGCLFHAEGRLPIAAQTLSSAAALAATIGFKLETEIDEPYQRALTSLKADLSEQRFASAWEVGQAIGLDEAVDLALNG